MAGIGFQLRKLSREDTLSSVIAAVGHAAVIAAGPWLFTILSLAGITLTTERIAGLETLAAFRIVIIYVFAISLVLTAPNVNTSTQSVPNVGVPSPPPVPTPNINADLSSSGAPCLTRIFVSKSSPAE